MKAKEKSLSNDYAKWLALTKIMIPSKPLQDKLLEGFKEAIRQYQCIAHYFEKEEQKKSGHTLHSDNPDDHKMVWLVAPEDFK